MSSTPAAASASASLVFWTQTPTAPASLCIRAIVALLCIFACGRRRTPWLRANAAMDARLRFIASRSITSAGVSIDSTGSPTRGSGAAALIRAPGERLPPRRERSSRHLRHGRAIAFAAVVERVAVEVGGVAPADQGEALAGEEQPVDAGVAELPRARRREVEAGSGAVQAVEHAAMADDEDRGATRALGDARDGGDRARAEVDQALAAFRRERRDRLRRVVGAHQVTREDRLDALAGERLGDARCLPAPARAESGVELALH